MITTAEDQILALHEPTITMLHELGISICRLGYKYLTVAVPCYSVDDIQSLTKEMYPYVAAHFGYHNWRSVERSIRCVILDAWERRDPDVWDRYFPDQKKVPTNKQFIATLAVHLRTPLPKWEGGDCQEDFSA